MTLFAINEVLYEKTTQIKHIRMCLLTGILVDADSLEPSLTLSTSCALVDPDQLDPVTRFTSIYQIIRQDHLDSPRQLPCRRSFWHLLYTDRLMIPERTKTVFHGDRVSLAVILRDHCGGRSCGEKGLGGDGAAIVIGSGMEMRGGLAVMDRFEHFGSDERACIFVWQGEMFRSSVSLESQIARGCGRVRLANSHLVTIPSRLTIFPI
jgi:hypothetical protein